MIHLTFFVGELTGTVTGIFVNNRRRLHFTISGFRCLIEEEIDESTLESRAFSRINRETCSGNFYTQIKINQPIFLGKLPMWKRILGQRFFRTTHFFNNIVIGILAFGNFLIRNVWNCEQNAFHFVSSSTHYAVQLLWLFFFSSYFCLCSLRFLTFSLTHQRTNLFGFCIHSLEKSIKFTLSLTTQIILTKHRINSLTCPGKMLFLQTFYHTFFIIGDLFYCKHSLCCFIF